MNIFKRYMAIVIALTSVQSFPLGAMKQEEQSNGHFSENKRKRDNDNREMFNETEDIKKRKLQEESFTEEISKSCSVCTELLCKESEKNISLPCSKNVLHIFHKECILSWARNAVLSRKIKKDTNKFEFQCPICKCNHLVEKYLSLEEINDLDSIKNPNTLENAREAFNVIMQSQSGLIIDQDINKFCAHIIKNGFWEIMEQIFYVKALMIRLNDANIEGIFVGAAEKGHFLIVQEFFKKENEAILKKISDKYFGFAFKNAAEKGHDLVVGEFFKKENEAILKKISDDDLEKAFIGAASNGYLLVVQEFFKEENKVVQDRLSIDILRTYTKIK